MATTIQPPLLFQGTLLNQYGNAIPEARIQLWQTDLDGNYLHSLPSATGSPKNPVHASIVDEFQYFGTDATDSNGKFEFLTYRPGVYPQRPYSHFHFMVWLEEPTLIGPDDGEEPLPALWTQFYFEGEAPPSSPEVLELDVTEVDVGLYNYGSYVNGTIIVDNGATADEGVLLPLSPAQPLGPFYPEVNFFSMDNDLTTADNTTTQAETTSSHPSGTPTKQMTLMPQIMPNTNGPTQQSMTKLGSDGPTTKQPTTQSPVSDGAEIVPAISTSPTLQPVQSASFSSGTIAGDLCSHILLGIWLISSFLSI